MSFSPRNLMDTLGMELLETSPERVIATMPVDERTVQPAGVLHGGATAALIETACSVGSFMKVSDSGGAVFGIELNVNHLKSVSMGKVTCIAEALRLGNRIHVWNARVEDQDGNLIAVGRLTLAVVNNNKT